MPKYKLSAKSGSRNRRGDFLAVVILIAFILGFGWLWWHQKHGGKKPKHEAVVEHQSVAPTETPPLPKPVEKESQPSVASPPPSTQPSTSASPVQPTNSVPMPAAASGYPRAVRTVLEAQIALVRKGISPGPIDGAKGSQTRAAIAAFQRSENLPETGILDTNTRAQLVLDSPIMTTYIVTSNDLAHLQPLGKTWLAKSQQSALDYETELQLVAEKFHAHFMLVEKWNPGVNWSNVVAGTTLDVPDVRYPDPDDKASFVVIHLSEKFLEAFDVQSNLMLHFPCSIAAKVEKRPVGELHVADIAPNPNYTFDPALFPESPEAQQIGHKLIIPPGPKNPVGVAWVGLDKPGYGIHGTPTPEQVGRTESHGCFRLANWDAAYFLKLAWVGLPVQVVQ